jgi:hypothetical protein
MTAFGRKKIAVLRSTGERIRILQDLGKRRIAFPGHDRIVGPYLLVQLAPQASWHNVRQQVVLSENVAIKEV